ncbi:chromosome segregation protein SMC [Macrococcus epidermidis]|uniref:chromosome segregation protein SMC n=1 Tax=Macrococcus epidermidis TaxID=1902580 RepID=UPI001EF22488|nr:chromosome segregation protein SMC [Macrococcus epidermidis]MCG7419871.1 chromosome segregation protein SMC [Macrococcus epidermidis]
MVYLKQVSAYGFKSFADKTTVNFDSGVTAIVGPNGSGKSNITDAIKWVLGEQSAKSLRGAKMEDVIFSGAQDRKPQNYAEVTLTMDNQKRMLNIDVDTVEVTRKLYRNGDSEYLLNKQKSRLKDVTELFLDSGLGRDAFSMISQGKVDQVLNAKPEERRQLIEEAAGVLKYKKRKKETESKLEDTNNNLLRVHDIIYDLKDRVEPLKIEASIAEEYLALSEEMKDADIQVTIADIESTRQDFTKFENEINEFNGLIQFKKEKSERLNEKLLQQKSERKTLQESIHNLNQSLLSTTEQIERHIGQVNVLKERLTNQNESSAKRSERLKKYNEQLTNELARKEEIETKIQTLSVNKKALDRQLKAQQKKLTELDLDNETLIDETRDSYYEKLSEQTALSNEIKLIEKEVEQFNQKQSKQQTVNNNVEQDFEAIQQTIGHLNNTITSKTNDLDKLREEYKQALSNIESRKAEYNTVREKYSQARRYIEDLERKRERLTLMQEEYQGYYQGVRILLKHKDQLNGIHTTVLDVIEIDAQYNDALDSALSASLQHIIVDDEQAGRAAIQFLRDKKYGRATFLPLSVIKPRSITHEVRQMVNNMPGFINTLNELIHTEQTYQSIIDNVSGNVLVCDTLKHANEIARAIGFKYRIVTLDGDIVNPGGSMSGGSKNKPTQALTARNDLQVITNQLAEFRASTEQLKKQVDTLSEMITTEEMKVNQLRIDGETLRDDVHQLKLSLEEATAKERRLKVMHEEVESLMKESEYIASRQRLIKVHRETIKAIELELVNLNARIQNFNNNASDKKSIEKKLNDNINDLKNELAVLTTKITHQTDILNERIAQIKDVQAEIDALHLDANQINVAAVEQEIIAKEETLRTLSEEKLAIESRMQTEDENLSELASSIDNMDKEYNELLRQISGIENGVGELKGKHSRLNVLLDNLINHLLEQYQMTFESAKDYVWETLGVEDVFQTDLEHLRKRVRLTKISIEELGNVNLNAIEQYKTVGERYEFLTNQEADLLEAKANLESIIHEMDETVSVRFMETFETVSRAFERIFKQLFGGGTGLLQLTSEDVLTAGIDIFVEPPGKRRQNLSLLSGGERALTAIVLLFSILQARSAPFVILDEVEAALDEANVNRFADFLNTLTQDTQFIVITHRKGTMEKSDRLYGVTMQNSGITQLVSVNLKDLDDKKLKELTK